MHVMGSSISYSFIQMTETANAISAITQSVRRQIERADQAERIARDAKKETTG